LAPAWCWFAGGSAFSGHRSQSGFFTVQVGAFRESRERQRLHDRLSASYSPIFIQQYDSPTACFYRVRVGRISGEDAARQFGEQLRDREGFTPFVTRLDKAHPQEQSDERRLFVLQDCREKIPSKIIYEDPISSRSRTSAPRRPRTS